MDKRDVCVPTSAGRDASHIAASGVESAQIMANGDESCIPRDCGEQPTARVVEPQPSSAREAREHAVGCLAAHVDTRSARTREPLRADRPGLRVARGLQHRSRPDRLRQDPIGALVERAAARSAITPIIAGQPAGPPADTIVMIDSLSIAGSFGSGDQPSWHLVPTGTRQPVERAAGRRHTPAVLIDRGGGVKRSWKLFDRE